MTESPLPEQAVAALNLGRKVEAIRIVREASGLGLKEAKDLVEAYVSTQPHLQGRQPGTVYVTFRGCLLFLLGLAAAAAVLIRFWAKKG